MYSRIIVGHDVTYFSLSYDPYSCFSGVKSLNLVFPRIVDHKCENEFIDTS